MKVLRVSIYARVSTDEQAKFGYSIQNQLDKLREYAEENNMLIVNEYIDEGFSASSTKRPALQEMINDLKNFDLIIFTKLDRFTRNVLDANEMVLLFDKNGVGIRAIDEEDVDTSTADGMFMFNLKVSLAQREIKKGSERITTVFDYKIKKGQAITGHQTFGYTTKEFEDYKIVVKDKDVEHIVEDMFNHFLTYHSVRKTSIYINEKYNLNFVYNTYTRFLKKDIYAGIYRGNTNYCKPYISIETYYKIQVLLKNNLKVRKNNNIYLFSGLIDCPCCGNRLSGVTNENKYGTKYSYYKCNKAKQIEKCDYNRIRESKIEDYLLQNINRLIEDHIITASVEIDKKPKPKINIKDITEEIDRLNYQYRKKFIKINEYEYEMEQLQKQLEEAEKQMPDKIDISSLHSFVNSGWQNVYRTLDKNEQRALFRSIIKKITIDKDDNINVDFL